MASLHAADDISKDTLHRQDNNLKAAEEQQQQPHDAAKPGNHEPSQAVPQLSEDAVKPHVEAPDDDDDPLGGFKFRGGRTRPVQHGAGGPPPKPR